MNFSTPEMSSAPHGPSPSFTKSHEHVDTSIANTKSLKTRVTELELVNDLLRSRILELEISEDSARRSEAITRESENLLRLQVGKLESKNQEHTERIANLRGVLLGLISKFGSALHDNLDTMPEYELDLENDDEELILNLAGQFTKNLPIRSNPVKNNTVFLQNASKTSKLEGKSTLMEGSQDFKCTDSLTLGSYLPHKKLKTTY